jgi:molybdenum cofactor cytidylyltransferase
VGDVERQTIYAVLLAAGTARRMGRHKLLMELGGRTVFEIALENHLESNLSGVCAVVPGWAHDFVEVAARRAGERTSFVRMSKPCEMSASLKSGWRWIMDKTAADAVMISLADQPLITSRTLNVLMDAYRASDKRVCIPIHQGVRGHPVIMDRRFDSEIMRLTGDRGARDLISERPELVLEVEIDSDEVVLDLDRTEDLQTIEARLSGRGSARGNPQEGESVA